MDYTKTIHEFLDGSLETSGEEEFFLNLAKDEEFRNELKQQLAMKEAIKSDTKAFTPAATSTMAIFSALGFSAPVVAEAATTSGIGAKAKNFFANYKQGLFSGIMSAAATVAIIFLLFNPMANTSNDGLPSKGSNFAGMSSAKQGLDLSIPKVVSKSIKTNEPVTIIKYVEVKEKKSAPEMADPDDQIAGKVEFKEMKYANHESNLRKPALNYENIANISEQEVIAKGFLIDEQKLNSGFTMEIRGSQDWLMNNSNISPASFPKFNNMSVTAMYSLSENLQAGIDIRRENFYQEFTGYDKIKKKVYNIQQQPNFTSAGIALRYTWNNEGLIPVINQLTLGATNAGMIGRFMIGSKYSPYHNISFVFGLEYSILRYFHQDQYFASPKVGLKYGVSYKL